MSAYITDGTGSMLCSVHYFRAIRASKVRSSSKSRQLMNTFRHRTRLVERYNSTSIIHLVTRPCKARGRGTGEGKWRRENNTRNDGTWGYEGKDGIMVKEMRNGRGRNGAALVKGWREGHVSYHVTQNRGRLKTRSSRHRFDSR